MRAQVEAMGSWLHVHPLVARAGSLLRAEKMLELQLVQQQSPGGAGSGAMSQGGGGRDELRRDVWRVIQALNKTVEAGSAAVGHGGGEGRGGEGAWGLEARVNASLLLAGCIAHGLAPHSQAATGAATVAERAAAAEPLLRSVISACRGLLARTLTPSAASAGAPDSSQEINDAALGSVSAEKPLRELLGGSGAAGMGMASGVRALLTTAVYKLGVTLVQGGQEDGLQMEEAVNVFRQGVSWDDVTTTSRHA